MLQKFDLSYFISKSYFDDDGSQYFLIFQPKFQYFWNFSGIVDKTFRWKSEELLQNMYHNSCSVKQKLYSKIFIVPK